MKAKTYKKMSLYKIAYLYFKTQEETFVVNQFTTKHTATQFIDKLNKRRKHINNEFNRRCELLSTDEKGRLFSDIRDGYIIREKENEFLKIRSKYTTLTSECVTEGNKYPALDCLSKHNCPHVRLIHMLIFGI